MKNTQPYTDRIKAIAKSEGVLLNDERALEVLNRMVELVPLVVDKKPKNIIWHKKYAGLNTSE